MIFREAIHQDLAAISGLERNPDYRSLVGIWSEGVHHEMLDDPDVSYTVAVGDDESIAGFAILRGLLSEHKSLELKRIVVGAPNQGVGRKLLGTVVEKAFVQLGAHRLWLDVFDTNARARHLYEAMGFQVDGLLREAYYRDGRFHSLVLMSMLDREYRAGTVQRPPSGPPDK